MFGRPFTNHSIRKMVVLFGSLFNNLYVVRETDSGVKKEHIKVILTYAPKEKFITRLTMDPTLTKSIALTLPRMSFELTGFAYDATRKQQSTVRHSSENTDATKRNVQYMGVPYTFNFNLSIYARNIDDGNMIVEQILPYFQPDYTVTADLVEEIGIKKDIPFILNSVEEKIDYEGDIQGAPRLITWDLGFTAKGWFFGPVSNTSVIMGVQTGNTVHGGVITNIYHDGPHKLTQVLTVARSSPQGFREEEAIVVDARQIVGKVLAWSNTSNTITITQTSSRIQIGDHLRGVVSSANGVVINAQILPLKLAEMTIRQTPITATAEDDFGYSTHILEYPRTL